jgi:hypothetical protein
MSGTDIDIALAAATAGAAAVKRQHGADLAHLRSRRPTSQPRLT